MKGILPEQCQLLVGHESSSLAVMSIHPPMEEAHCCDSEAELGTSLNAGEVRVEESQFVSEKSINNNTSPEINLSLTSKTKSFGEVQVQKRTSSIQLCKNSVVGCFKVSGSVPRGIQLKGQCGHTSRELEHMSSREKSENHIGPSSECLSVTQMAGTLSHSGVPNVPCDPSGMLIVKQVESKKKSLKYKPDPTGDVKLKRKLDQHYLYPYKAHNSSNASGKAKGIQCRQTNAVKGLSKNREVQLQNEEEVGLINAQLRNRELKGPFCGISCIKLGSKGGSQNQLQAQTSSSRLFRNRICRGESFQKRKSKQAASKSDTVLDHIAQHHFLPAVESSFKANLTALPKKPRKLPLSPIPIDITLSNSGRRLLSLSEYELVWAAATNCLPQKDNHKEGVDRESTNNIVQAKMRLNLTTQLMQQLVHPLPLRLMQGRTSADYECTIYALSKLAIGDACGMVAGDPYTVQSAVQGQVIQNNFLELCESSTSHKNLKGFSLIRMVQSVMETINHVDTDLSRLEGSTSISELICRTCELEMLSIGNRMRKHYGNGFSLESVVGRACPYSEPGLRRLQPEKYVTAIPLPKAIPQAVTWLSL